MSAPPQFREFRQHRPIRAAGRTPLQAARGAILRPTFAESGILSTSGRCPAAKASSLLPVPRRPTRALSVGPTSGSGLRRPGRGRHKSPPPPSLHPPVRSCDVSRGRSVESKGRAVKTLVCLHFSLDRVTRKHACAPAVSKSAPQLRLRCEACQCPRKRLWITGRNEEAVLLGLDHVAGSGDSCGDTSDSTCHRLEKGDGTALHPPAIPCRQDGDVELPQESRYVCHIPEKANPLPETGLGDCFSELFCVALVTGSSRDQEKQPRNSCNRFQEGRMALDRNQVRYTAGHDRPRRKPELLPNTRLSRQARPKALRVDTWR